MPLVQAADEEGAGEAAQGAAPATPSARQTCGHADHGKGRQMRQLVPWRREQAHGERLRAQHLQADARQHHGGGGEHPDTAYRAAPTRAAQHGERVAGGQRLDGAAAAS